MKNYFILEKNIWLLGVAILACFATVRVIGLAPDAALYAGLARKILETGEAWRLAGTENFFPKFYEHPPYFFQWGAWLMSWMGVSDASAKLMGAIPSFLALLLLCFFLLREFSWNLAAFTLVMLATTGHFTKYAATSLLEAPLALFTLVCLLSTYVLFQSKVTLIRLLSLLGILIGISGATASKGVVGLGCLGGVLLVYVGRILRFNQPLSHLFFRVPFLTMMMFVAAASPFLLWLKRTWTEVSGFEWIMGYLHKQVFRSATTDRGEAFFQEANNHLYFIEVIVRNAWPWWWTVPVGYYFLFLARRGDANELMQKTTLFARMRVYSVIALCFFIAFLVPLSLVTYKLPHYMHPTYMLMAPVGAYGLMNVLARARWFLSQKIQERALALPRMALKLKAVYWRWLALAVPSLFFIFQGPRVTSTPNRGQEFFALYQEHSDVLQSGCEVWVPESEVGAYRMEAYSLWYLKGASWKLVAEEYPSEVAVPRDVIFWRPKHDILWKGRDCRA